MENIFWKNHSNLRLKNWQDTIEQLTTSTFCVLPWIHFTTRPNGDMRLCCVSNASGVDDNQFTSGIVKNACGSHANFAKDLPSAQWNNEYMRDVRTTMIDGKIPSSCTKCFKEEQSGIVSKRVWETLNWHKTNANISSLLHSTVDGVIPVEIPYIDLRLGHTCNLKCVMCGPTDSSKWVAESKKLIPLVQDNPVIVNQIQTTEFNNSWFENPNFWSDIAKQIPTLKQLNFAGGEPLMIKEHKEFIRTIINQGYSSQISLKYNTNGLLIDNDIIDLWTKFKKVQVGVSIDALDTRNYYIRYPSNWATIEKNLNILDTTPDNIEVTIACALQVFNIKHLPDFVKWKVIKNYKKVNLATRPDNIIIGGGLLNLHMVYMPTYLDMRILPKEDKDEITQSFYDLKQWLLNNYTTDSSFWDQNPFGWLKFESILKFLHSEDKSHLLPSFKQYASSLDTIRGLRAINYFPELASIL